MSQWQDERRGTVHEVLRDHEGKIEYMTADYANALETCAELLQESIPWWTHNGDVNLTELKSREKWPKRTSLLERTLAALQALEGTTK